jgi:hypothetical protein
MRRNGWMLETTATLGALFAVLALAQACGDDDGPAEASSGSTTTSTTGAGTGGAGGAGTGECLDPTAYTDIFSLNDDTLCAVAVYTMNGRLASPTWGRHGGPLMLRESQPQGSIELVRLTPPADATGQLTEEATVVDAGIQPRTFLGGQAIDLPFFDWTAISWTNQFPDTSGEVVLIAGNAVAKRYDVNGFYAATAIEGRLLYTGLSPLGEATASANGLYAADRCGALGQNPRLLPEGDAACAAPTVVASWGDYSGPVAADSSGNAFAVLVSASGEQEARGFAADTVARGTGPYAGDVLFTLPGGGRGLAALAPRDAAAGLLVFQPSDPLTYDPLDPVAVTYRASAASLEVGGAPAPLLTVATPATPLSMVVDREDRLWVGAPSPAGGATFVVLARR